MEESLKDQLKCAGIATTVGVLFPDAGDALPIDDFFAAIGVSEYAYGIEESPEQGWFSFQYHDLDVWLDTASDSFCAGNAFTPVQTIRRGDPLVIYDLAVETENLALIED